MPQWWNLLKTDFKQEAQARERLGGGVAVGVAESCLGLFLAGQRRRLQGVLGSSRATLPSQERKSLGPRSVFTQWGREGSGGYLGFVARGSQWGSRGMYHPGCGGFLRFTILNQTSRQWRKIRTSQGASAFNLWEAHGVQVLWDWPSQLLGQGERRPASPPGSHRRG